MRRRVVHALALGILISVAVTGLSQVGVFSGWEVRAVDAFLFVRNRPTVPDPVLVVIDDAAFRELGQRQPIPRDYLALLIDVLRRSGARVVAVDVHVPARSRPEEDAALLAAAQRTTTLVLATIAIPRSRDAYEAEAAFESELPAAFGFSNAPRAADGVIREMIPLLPAASGGYLPSFALAVLAADAGHRSIGLVEALRARRGPLALPAVDERGHLTGREPVPMDRLVTPWRINFVGPAGSFTTVPSGPIAALARSRIEPDPDNPFRGKIVLVGATFPESRDLHPTPTGMMAGVEIQANMVYTLLSRRTHRPPPWTVNLALLVGACLVVSLLSVSLRPVWVVLVALGLATILVVSSYEAYTRGGYWLDFVAPLGGMMAYLQGSAMLARRRVRTAFGQFVSPEVVERVLREGAALGGEVRTVTVLMSDLRGFTTLAEQLPIETVTEIVNSYFTVMVERISVHGGVVQDFIGDGILAVYGAPLADLDHAWHAVLTAIGMQAALDRLNERLTARKLPALRMGVAIHTGEVFAGNVGSPRRKKYAVLGDTVNTVSRIEGQNRELSTAILISGATLAVVKDRVIVRDQGAVPMKGKAHLVELFALVSTRERHDDGPEV